MQLVDDVFRHGDGVDEESGLVGNGNGERIGVLGPRESEIAVKAAGGFARDADAVGRALVLGDGREVDPVPFLEIGILFRFRDLTDGEFSGDDGVFHSRCARKDGDVRFGKERLGHFDFYVVFSRAPDRALPRAVNYGGNLIAKLS